MVKYDDLLYLQVMVQVEYGVEISDYEFNELLEEIGRVNAEGTEIFARDRRIRNLDKLLYLYISADKGLEETIGLKHALGTYIKGIFQSKLNHNALLKGIKNSFMAMYSLSKASIKLLSPMSAGSFRFEEVIAIIDRIIKKEILFIFIILWCSVFILFTVITCLLNKNYISKSFYQLVLINQYPININIYLLTFIP